MKVNIKGTSGVDEVAFTARKNDWEVISFAHRTFRNKDYVDIRQFYRSPKVGDASLKPSVKGVNMHLDSFWGAFQAMCELRDYLIEKGLIPAQPPNVTEEKD